MKVLFAVTVILLASLLVGAQALPSFEVATVKQSAPITGGRVRIGMGGDPGRVNYEGVPLRMIMARAYGVKDYQISGPDWLNSERFDVIAKIPEGVAQDQIPAMLQALLIERFKLVTHKEKKEMPVYGLVQGKGGIKAKEVDPNAEGANQFRMGMGKLTTKVSMSGLCDFLARIMDRPVLDMTETKAIYDISLEYTPEPGQGMFRGMPPPPPGDGGGRMVNGQPAPDSNAPSIFTALQEQLGLKLESRKAPVEMVVVDSAQKVPTEN